MASILYVDDDIDLAGSVKQWLKYENQEVTLAHTGAEGWSSLEANQYEAVVLDWDLPDISGIEILKRLRYKGDNTPVIMLTGRTAVGDRVLGLDSGANDYLTKPFQPEELSARIRAALRVKQTAAAAPKPLGRGNEDLLLRANLQGSALASRYEFLSILGEGAMAIVFKARHPHLDKLVAVKMMILDKQLSDVLFARFEQEARAIGKFEHPNIAIVYDFGLTEKRMPYMVMEFVEGKPLSELIEQKEPLALARAFDIFIQISAGMAHAHAAGIIHRDLKPANIIIREAEGGLQTAKILDFGCAKMIGPAAPQQAKLTQHDTAIGSPAYMSPEQATGKQPDQRSDIYSLGCLIYETLTGRVPYLSDDPVETMVKQVNEVFLPLRLARPDLTFPSGTEHLMARALAKDPQKRYQSMQELKHDLENLKSKLQSSGGMASGNLLVAIGKKMTGWLKPSKD